MLKCYDIKIERVLEGFECQSDCHHACEELFQKARVYYRKKKLFSLLQLACAQREAPVISYYDCDYSSVIAKIDIRNLSITF